VRQASTRRSGPTTGRRSKQFSFFCAPEELSFVAPLLHDLGACLLASESQHAKPEHLNRLPGSEVPSWFIVYACPEHLTSQVICRLVREQQVYVIDQTGSPVVEILQPISRDRILTPGRFYCSLGCWMREGWVEFPDDVSQIYDALVKAMKSMIVKGERRFQIPVTRRALEMEQGGAELRFQV